MRGPVIKPACRKWYMAVHIITHAFGMTEDRESPSIPRVLFNLLQICDLRVIEKYMNGIAWAKSVNPEHFKVSTGKCSRNSMIKWSKYSSFNHCRASSYVNWNRCASVFIPECLHVQDTAKSFTERFQGQIQKILRYSTIAMFDLPQIPDTVDHAVVGVKDGIEGGSGDVHHVSTYPHMHIVVETFQAVGKRCPVAIEEYIIYFILGWKSCL